MSTIGRKPSYLDSDPTKNDADYDREWQTKVTEWRSDLQELGIFKNRNETLQRIRSAGTTSVLAYLQSTIQID